MKCKLAFLFLFFPPFTALAHHCPALDAIKQVGLFYTAETAGGEEWQGIVQGSIPQNKTAIKDFSEALISIDQESLESNAIEQGKFQKCIYNLQADGWQLDMYYGNKTWRVSISGKPHWKYQQTPLFEMYQCSGVAAEQCKFDILPSAPTF
ncbi:DUF3757 domain-containing protein [Yersinia hibernica]|uniref:DUF3757 domain-containing protein n=1 Tax=Yersinia enterocolitica LC20 TaxID=1443113 RepID=A0A7U4GIC4_YEREN|nr:DUF3757 domain-containing protein [Yersinia hibernica]AHM76035.1 DUF3757 domain-containing protein [Yersinia hibernica]OVZ92338.1 hypothetical protein CBW54_04130 [Yersinia kristensenii]